MKRLNTSLVLLALILTSFLPGVLRAAAAVDPACAGEAIDENASQITAAWTTYNVAMNAALKARADAMKVALAIEDDSDRWPEMQKALKTYAKSVKTATKAFNKSKRLSRLEFMKALKTCGASAKEASNSSAE